MKKTFISAFLCFSMVAGITPAIGQSSSVGDQSKTFEVRLPIAVKDKDNNLVMGLTRNDFVIFEDGVEQEATFFTDQRTNPPVFVGVIMDTSPSTAGKLEFSKSSAKNFIYTVTRLRKDKAAFLTFDNEITMYQDFTDKLDLLDKAVDQVKRVGTQTALYDAIWQFTDEKLRNAPGRRVIVLITDGDDTFSRADLEDVIDIAQRTETTVYAISTKQGFLGTVPGVEIGTVKDRGDKLIERLCAETGGEAFFTGDVLALERAFKRISQELSSQYILTYRPANQEFDGKRRRIEVRFRDRQKGNDLRIRTKTEYRAIRDEIR